MTIKTHGWRVPGNHGADLVIRIGRRWMRFGMSWGQPPGSHIGLWRTVWAPLYGLNLRIGKRYVGPCLTMWAHTKRTD